MASITKLEAFLEMPNVSEVTKEIFVGGKFGYFKISPVSLAQSKSYKRQSRDHKTGEVDIDKFNMLIVVNHIVEPDFSNKEFLDKAGFVTPEDVINAKIPAVAFANIVDKIIRESGLDVSLGEMVEEAKN